LAALTFGRHGGNAGDGVSPPGRRPDHAMAGALLRRLDTWAIQADFHEASHRLVLTRGCILLENRRHYFLRVLPLFDGEKFRRENTLYNTSKIALRLGNDVTIGGVLYPKPPALEQIEEDQRARGTYDGLKLCRAAIQPSPADPPVP
jgi:hypothetical protein